MSPEQPATHDTSPQDSVLEAQDTVDYEQERQEYFDQTDPLELPRRPRRRLLAPVPLALSSVLLIACGFIGGVLVEKGQSSSSPSTGAAGAIASRLEALRGASSGRGARSGVSGAAGLFGGSSGSGGFSRPSAGTVAYLAGSTLYVTNTEGNTIKVTTSAGTTVNKTVKSTVKSIHPGETVTITGATGSNGAISAESISVGSSGGFAGLFGGSGGRGGTSGRSAGGEPALFGG
jgi:hypothetical protein